MKKLIVFASGTKDGGGSGFQKLVENSRNGVLNAEIVAVVSNHTDGGIKRKTEELDIPFIHFAGPYEAKNYQMIVKRSNADWIALSGWLKYVSGLDPRRTINIHPGPLPRFGGGRMYGHRVHEAVLTAYKNGEIKYSAVAMHFVTDPEKKEYDRGPIFFQRLVPIKNDDTAETLTARVNEKEHEWQSPITNLVVEGHIRWDGKNPDSLVAPDWIPRHTPPEFQRLT